MPKDLNENAPNVSALAKACGVVRSTIYAWQRDSTFPQPIKGKGFDLFAVGVWKGRKDEALRQRERIPGDDPFLSGGASPELERYRAARASMAEMDLAERERVTFSAEVVHDLFNEWSKIFRQATETLQQQFGPEAQAIMHQAVEEAVQVVDKYFSSQESYDGRNDGAATDEVAITEGN